MYTNALNILKKLNKNGYEAYIVGGYPRDLYLERTSVDIDICTNATPKEIKDVFGNAMLHEVNYGSVTVIKNKIRFEITTFRRDIKYVNNRFPVEMEYVDNLLEDLKRRDFTINTLCIDSEGNRIDLLDGIKDIDNKIIRTVGNPKIKLREDALRILRAIRFATELDFKLDEELKKYIKEYKHLLKNLSYERKKEELEKIFSSKNVRYGLELIQELGLDEPLELHNINDVVPIDSIGIWSQLDVLDIYPFTKEEKQTIKIVNEYKNSDLYDIDTLYKCSKYGLGYLYMICSIKGIDFKEIEKKYINLPIKSKKDIDFHPNDLIKLGIQGPEIKEIMDDLEYKILHDDIENKREVLKYYILNIYK